MIVKTAMSRLSLGSLRSLDETCLLPSNVLVRKVPWEENIFDTIEVLNGDSDIVRNS
jgi:hypothetical protein